MSDWLSAFGAKQTSDETVAWLGPTLMTRADNEWPLLLRRMALTCYT
jgi:hypothetical protein